jgi:hypothetical protein
VRFSPWSDGFQPSGRAGVQDPDRGALRAPDSLRGCPPLQVQRIYKFHGGGQALSLSSRRQARRGGVLLAVGLLAITLWTSWWRTGSQPVRAPPGALREGAVGCWAAWPSGSGLHGGGQALSLSARRQARRGGVLLAVGLLAIRLWTSWWRTGSQPVRAPPGASRGRAVGHGLLAISPRKTDRASGATGLRPVACAAGGLRFNAKTARHWFERPYAFRLPELNSGQRGFRATKLHLCRRRPISFAYATTGSRSCSGSSGDGAAAGQPPVSAADRRRP